MQSSLASMTDMIMERQVVAEGTQILLAEQSVFSGEQYRDAHKDADDQALRSQA
jgi:hypothetical protein